MNELTREQILSMELDELSLAVAEHVFKARTIGSSHNEEARLLIGEFGAGAIKPLTGGRWQTACWRNSDEKAWLDCPRYAEDISAAWEVADKLKIAIIPQSISAPNELKYLARAEWDFKHNEIDVFGYTAPEAICKAALLAVMGL